MLSFQLLIAFPEQIDSMKADLTRYFPDIKSSHRVEALARALGFNTYAALRTADPFKGGPAVLADVNWTAFDDYLKEKNFQARAKPLFLAAGRASIRLTLGMKERDYQNLTRDGFGINTSHHRGETPQARTERFIQAREDMLQDSSVEEFLRSYSVVSRIPKTKTVTSKHGAYKLKHIAEKASFTYPDGEKSPPAYVPTGSLIFAAVSAGFWFKPPAIDSQSVSFNMLQSAIDDLDCGIRPYGAAAKERKKIPNSNSFGGVQGRKFYEYVFEEFDRESSERDFGMAFRCLGHSNGLYFYLSYERKSIIALTPTAHTLKNLAKLGTIEAWMASTIWSGTGTGKRIPFKTVSDLMRTCHDRGLFGAEEIKNPGRWGAA
ncbi:MAG: hypothetical protein RBT70_00750 [Alphaproteobacteria bacterium]|nr:hypothetical protein [Alphaproteobacteria bacterium]